MSIHAGEFDAPGETCLNDESEYGPPLESFLASDPSHLPFLGERPTLSEDYVQYQIFADKWDSIQHLQQLREEILSLVESLTSGHIWHHEGFALSVIIPSTKEIEPHLHGLQIVGENASDEWLVCYLLCKITTVFSGLTACVSDGDGEILLIEAATAIPPFLSPLNSNHRVWLRSGEVHLVMPGCIVNRERTPYALGSGRITLPEGLGAVRENDGKTKADKRVQNLIKRRISGYPGKIVADLHHARCFLPLSVALVLRDAPELIAAAVNAYCHGDAAEKKQGIRMARFLPPMAGGREQPDASRFVEDRIKFTRHFYAKLRQEQVIPAPKTFPQGWGPKANGLSSADYLKAAQLGQKVSLGLEMAYQNCARRGKRRAEGNLRGTNPRAWSHFLEGLERNGFFEGAMKGSERYSEKLDIAERFLQERILEVQHEPGEGGIAYSDGELHRCAIHEKVDLALSLRDEGRGRPFETPHGEYDSEDWLEVSQSDINKMLQEYQTGVDSATAVDMKHVPASGDPQDTSLCGGSRGGMVDGNVQPSQSVDGTHAWDKNMGIEVERAVNGLDDIATGIKSFVEDPRAGPAGAEVEQVGGNVEFDVDKFMSLLNGEDLRDALDEAAEESASDGLCDSDDSTQELQQELSEDEDEDEADMFLRSTRMQESGRDRTTLASQSSNANLGMEVGLGSGVNSKDPPIRMKTGPASRSADSGSCGAIGSTDHRLSGQGKTPAVGENSTLGLAGWDKTFQKINERDGLDSFLEKYMTAMELELDPSCMGQSFEKVGKMGPESHSERLHTKGPGPRVQNTQPAGKVEYHEGIASAPPGDDHSDAQFDAMEAVDSCYQPVDVDMNLVKHILESTVSQEGIVGPASNLLRSLGLDLPAIPKGGGWERDLEQGGRDMRDTPLSLSRKTANDDGGGTPSVPTPP